ncbi:MAG: Hsp70 family protein [Myxococcota bacterium]
MSDAVGIDLGTSRVCVAIVEDGRPRVVPARDGALCQPCCVAFGRKGPIFGDEALRSARDQPEATIFGFMRLLGRKFHSPEVDWLRAGCPYDVVAAANGDAMVQVFGRDYTIPEVLSYLIEHLKQRVELTLERPIRRATFAVPAHYDELQRRAVVQAARLAGLDDCDLVHGTTAAATEWASSQTKRGQVCFLSLGAGSFEVSLIEIAPGSVRVVASAGDPMLGGDDVDRRLVLRFLDQFQEMTGVDAADDRGALATLFETARTVKHELTERSRTGPLEVTLGELGVFRDRGFSRRQLVELVSQELAGLKDPCRWAFEDAGLGTDDIDEVLVLGGGMRMPAVRSVVKYLLRTEGSPVPNEATAVAMGAARVALSATDTSPTNRGAPTSDIAVHSTGIKVRGGKFLPVVARGTPTPCDIPKAFDSGSQSRVVFELYQGEHDLATENIYVGRITLQGIQQGRFMVNFGLDASGMLKVGDVDPGGRWRPLEIQLAGGLTEDEMTLLSAQRTDRGVPSHAPAVSSGRPGRRPSTLRIPRATAPKTTSRSSMKRVRPESEADEEQPLRQSARAPGSPPSGEGRARSHSATVVAPPTQTAPSRRPPPPPRRVVARVGGGRPAEGDTPTMQAQVLTPRNAPLPPPPPDTTIEVGADSLVGTVLGDRYQIEEIIGEGGMGRVYLARHRLLGKQFAIKVLHPELAAKRELAERFVREARAASSIDSDHVVDISDFGLLGDGTGYFVMEYLDGKNLEERLDAEGPQPAAAVRRIAIQVADALRGAHAQAIVHRDLKPSNIVLSERKGRDFCKILDFGIAKSPTSDSGSGQTIVTQVGVMMGTPHYMAPEQIDGEVDPRSDIYALGIVMFEMVAGNPPFDAESIAELLAQQKWTKTPSIRDAYPPADCSDELEHIIRRCLAKKPEERFQSAAEIMGALEALDTTPS